MFLLIFGIFFVLSDGNQFPPGVTLCHRSDPNFNKCVGKTLGDSLPLFANGSKHFGIPKLDPIFIKEMVLKTDPTQSVAVQQTYLNIHLYGMTNSNCEQNFRMDLDKKCGWVMDVRTPLLRLEGDYKLLGTLLMFPLNGHGKCDLRMYNLVHTHTMTCEKYTVKNKTYLRTTNYTINAKPESFKIYYENLFPGNEQISAEILKTMNENALLLFNDIKSGFEQIFSTIHLTMSNKVFSKVPIDEIFLE